MLDPLVLLPALMSDARLFGPQIAELGSETPITFAPLTDGERIEELASGLLTRLPRRFAVAGVGLGGMVAMELLRRAPDRVSRLALISTTPLPDTPQVAGTREPQMIKARTGKLAEVIESEFPVDALAPTAYRQEILDLVADMADALGPEVYVRQSRALQRRRDQQSVLRKCKLPTLVMCGAYDTITPVKRHSVTAEFIPNARLVVIDDAGHLPTLEQPGLTSASLREWLKMPMILS